MLVMALHFVNNAITPLSARTEPRLATARAMVLVRASGPTILAHSAWHFALRTAEALILPLRTTALAVFCGAMIYGASYNDNLTRLRAGLRLGGSVIGANTVTGCKSFTVCSHTACTDTTGPRISADLPGFTRWAPLRRFVRDWGVIRAGMGQLSHVQVSVSFAQAMART